MASAVAPKSGPTGTIYALPSSTNGVALNPPGLLAMGPIAASIQEACKLIPVDHRLALVAVTGGSGTNIAVVARIGDDLAVKAWLGRSWKKADKTEWGAQLMWSL